MMGLKRFSWKKQCFALVLILSCHQDRPNHSMRPNDRFMKDDMEIVSCRDILLLNDTIKSIDPLSFQSLREIAIQANSKYLFLLSKNGEVFKVDKFGKLIYKISNYGQGPGEMSLPIMLKHRNGKLYVLDRGNRKIVIFSDSGKWIEDITLGGNSAESFEVNSDDEIIVPQIIPIEGSQEPLFQVLDHKGSIIRKYSNNRYINEDFVAAYPRPALFITPDDCIFLVLRIHGTFYKFSKTGELIFKSDICGGQEWDESIDAEIAFQKSLNVSSHQLRLNDLFFGENGNIYASWGGKFKSKQTLAIIYNSRGMFIGRVFQNNLFANIPTLYTLSGDSSFWIYNDDENRLAECTIRQAVND